MPYRVVFGFLAVCIAVLSALFSPLRREPARAAHEPPARADVDYGRVALDFEANRGQADPDVRFVARGAGYGVLLTDDGAVVSLVGAEGTDAVRLRVVGAREGVILAGREPREARSHYYRGNDPRRWVADVPRFASVQAREVYPGIDLVYHAKGRQLEYDFVVAPQADPAKIRLRFEGARELRLGADGDLELHLDGGVLTQHVPYAYQDFAGERRQVPASYVLDGAEVAMRVGAYDRSQPLVIDPVLGYSTYFGGTGWDSGHAIAVDSEGQAIIVGNTTSIDMPIAAAWQPSRSRASGGEIDVDMLVAKLNTRGDGLVFATYLGGVGDEDARAVALGPGGDIYIGGQSASAAFPLLNPYQSTSRACDFNRVTPVISRLTPAGQLVYSTYFGYCGTVAGIGVDAAGNILVTGATRATDFPLANAFRTTAVNAEAFVSKLNAAGDTLLYSTYLGGSQHDGASAIAVDSSGSAHVVGETQSQDFPLRNAYQATSGGVDDAFLTRLTPAGALVYSTYVGGESADRAFAVDLDAAGNAYVAGKTHSFDFPLANPVQTSRGDWTGGGDGFAFKMGPDGRTLLYSTYLGGPSLEGANGIAAAPDGGAVVTGSTDTWTTMPAFPGGAMTPTDRDVFVVELSSTGGAYDYAWHIQARDADVGMGVALDSAGAAYVTGHTRADDFPVTAGAFQTHPPETNMNGAGNAFVLKITGPDDPPPPPAFATGSVEERHATVTYGIHSDTWFANNSSIHRGGAIYGTTTGGALVTLSFRGTGVRCLGYRDEWSGLADVYVDGRLRQTIDTYASPAQAQAVLFEVTGLANQNHALTIRVRGARSAASGGNWVWLDGFDVLGGGAPTATASPTATATPTSTVPTATPTPTGAPTATPTPGATPGRVEQDSAMVAYAGNWYTNPHSAHSGGSAVLGMDAGDRATFTFTGTRARWIGYRDEWSGIARVSIDGVAQAMVDTYLTPQAAGVVLFQTPVLANGTHTLTIEATGTRSASSGGAWIWVDAFEWEGGSGTPAPTPTPTPTSMPTATATPTPVGQPTALEETAASFDGSWYPNSHPVHSGGRAVIAVDAGSRATLTFTGTGATWIGYADEWSGIARVYVDGALRATVDTYATPFQARKRQYTVSGLAAGTHTLAVEATGTANPSSGGGGVWVDGFEVTP